MADNLENRVGRLENTETGDGSEEVVIIVQYHNTILDEAGERHEVPIVVPESKLEVTCEFDHQDGYHVRILKPRPEGNHRVLRDDPVTQ
jgi:hypothetical protein